ncbi:hypothetical protein EV175_000785 [Coemansia sp. RSA 1933]|nr:hypothetical protein EV175_000785 [Coemansia sp. RSA 1933]
MSPQEATAPKKKRPMGLKARAANKKQKNEDITDGDTTGINDFDEANMATIMLKNTTGANGEATEVDELEGIFDSAMSELSGGESDDTAERALTLLRGTIHECDRILRVHDENTKDQKDAVPLEPRFYYIYGTALYSITELSDTTDRKEYLELAFERLDQARAAITGSEPFAWRVHVGMAKAALELLALLGESKQDTRCLDAPLVSLDGALVAMEHDTDTQTETETLAIVDLVLSLADSRTLTQPLNSRLVTWCETTLREMLKTNTTADIQYLLARTLWLQASELIDMLEDDDDDDEQESSSADKERVAELLSTADELLREGATSDALLLRGEVVLNLGNVQDSESEQERLYGVAVDTFRRAQEIGDIPDQFVQLINDFEQDGSDDDQNSNN